MHITQGFIGSSTKPVVTTTLGREGSDYTGAIFANLLDAKELSVWKDVDGDRTFFNSIYLLNFRYISRYFLKCDIPLFQFLVGNGAKVGVNDISRRLGFYG